MENKTVLIGVNFLVEVPTRILGDDSGTSELDNIEKKLSELGESIETKLKIEWESSQAIVLDPSTLNCGVCESCGCWVSNREANDPIPQLNVGALFEGKLLCDECLPKNHELAF